MINWKAVPALRVLTPLCAGIFLAVLLPGYFFHSFSFCLALLPAIFYLSHRKIATYAHRWWFGVCLNLFWLSLGYVVVGLHDEYYAKDYFAKSLHSDQEQQLVLLVDEPPVRKNKGKFTAAVLDCNGQKCVGHLLCYIDTCELAYYLRYGDVVAVNARVQAIEPPPNPHAYDFQHAMKLKNVRFSAFAKSENLQLLASKRGNPLMDLVIRIQGELIRVLGEFVTDADALSVGSALILGYRSDISDEITQAYVNTGAMHVLSVSGLHVGLVASLIGWLLGRRPGGGRYRKLTDALIQMLLVWGFALVTGASSCVLRAAVMFTFLIIGRAISREANIYNALLASAFFLLLYNPYFLFDVGFQLSYLGLLGILYFHPYVYQFGMQKVALFSEYYIGNQIWNLTAVSIAAMLTTTPLSLYYFHRFPAHFWLSGLVVVPLSTLVLYLGLFLFAICKWGFVAYWTGKLLQAMILLMNCSLQFIEGIPPGVLRDFWLNPFETVFWYLVLIAFAAALYRKQLIWLKYGLSLSILLGINFAAVNFRASQQHLLVVYDVGPELLIDFFEGKKLQSICSTGLSDKKEEFAALNNRTAHRVASGDVNRLQLSEGSVVSKMFYHNGKNILLLAGVEDTQNIPANTEVELLIVYESPRLNLEELLAKIRVKQVVFAGKIKPKPLQYYIQECERLGLKHHDTGNSGALTFEW